MTVKDLEQLLSMVPDNTQVRFEIDGVEGHAPSAEIKYTHEFATERGEFSTVPEVDSLTISVGYGPEKVQE